MRSSIPQGIKFVLPPGMEGVELARAKCLIGVSLLASLLAFSWLFVQPTLLTTPDRLVLWVFSVSLMLAAPIVLRVTRSLMAAWVLHAAAVLTPITALAAMGSPNVLQHAFWLAIMPAIGSLVAGTRGLITSATLAIIASAVIALLGNYGVFGPVSSPVALISPLVTTIVISTLLAMQIRQHERVEERLLDVRTDAETAHEAAVHADRLSTLGLLASGVAHGVNNPLTLLLQNVNTLLTEFSSSQRTLDRAQVHGLVSELAAGLLQVRTAVEALGTFSDDSTTAGESTDLESVLGHVVHLIQQAAGPRIRVDMRLESLGYVSGTKLEIGQLFLNLLVNAVQAIPDDNMDHHIEVVGAPIGEGWIAVEVRDDGEGISHEHVPRVWDPYFTTRDVGHGAGLGLFVVGNTIRRMGGTAELRSRPGLGTTVRLLIPLADATATVPQDELVPTPSSGGRARILVVDDESLPLRVVCRALQHRYNVITEVEPAKAYERLANGEQIDLVISDIMMPGMTGDELCREVLKVRPDLEGRFLFITGAMLRDGQQEWLATAGARVLRKPFGIEQLRRFVGEQLGDCQAEGASQL